MEEVNYHTPQAGWKANLHFSNLCTHTLKFDAESKQVFLVTFPVVLSVEYEVWEGEMDLLLGAIQKAVLLPFTLGRWE